MRCPDQNEQLRAGEAGLGESAGDAGEVFDTAVLVPAAPGFAPCRAVFTTATDMGGGITPAELRPCRDRRFDEDPGRDHTRWQRRSLDEHIHLPVPVAGEVSGNGG